MHVCARAVLRTCVDFLGFKPTTAPCNRSSPHLTLPNVVHAQIFSSTVGGIIQCPIIKHPKLGMFVPPSTSPKELPIAEINATSMTNLSIAEIIATTNGRAWLGRRESIQEIVTPKALRQHLSIDSQENSTDLSGQDVYANAAEQQDGKNTNYDIVNAWQVNYVCGKCALNGRLLALSGRCHNDDAMFGSFHSARARARPMGFSPWASAHGFQPMGFSPWTSAHGL